MAIDSHMHINSIVLEKVKISDYINEIINNPDIKSVINVGINIDTSNESLLISKIDSKFYSTIGIHPLYTESQDVEYLYELVTHDRVVAIGEIGLDSTKNNFDEQKSYLIKQIIIANELHLPVVIHANNTNKLIIEIFKKYVKPKYGCVFHCFQPDIDDLKYLIENGYYISFAGRITYKTAKKSIVLDTCGSVTVIVIVYSSSCIYPSPKTFDFASLSYSSVVACTAAI